MTVIDIFSGFLGAGKTTLIKKLIKEAYAGEKLVLIENEFGEIGIDGGFMQEAGVQINELNSGCICCSLVGDFRAALEQVLETYAPTRILIEPSGVGKLSDVAAAVRSVCGEQVALGALVTVADAGKCRMYMKNFGEFYNDQIENATAIVLSRTQNLSDEKVAAAVAQVREHNAAATVVTTPWDELSGEQLAEAMAGGKQMEAALLAETHHHHEHHDHECGCGHHHHEHHDHECECGHHHHEHHDHECECGHHHHNHHDHECECGHHHHNHHADEVFASWGRETARRYSEEELHGMLTALDSGRYGTALRAKGILPAVDGGWWHFDYVPFEQEIRAGSADYTGRLCVIGAALDESALARLFCLE